MIQELPENISRKINSQQYIHNSYIIVKELVENALDSGAKKIKVHVSEDIVVEDDGCGIEDLDKVCRAGYTSKEINSYRVLGIEMKNLDFSHGFRGQALAAISELCDVVITTNTALPSKTKDGEEECDYALGSMKDYRTGILKKYPREKGTTFRITNLFKNCPLRRRINEKSMRKNLVQIISFTRALCYVYNVHFTILDHGKVIFADQGSDDSKEYAIEKHGIPFLEIEDPMFYFILFPLSRQKIQNILLEKRYIVNNRIVRLVNNIFRKHFDYFPTFLIILYDEADVNVSVDKTEVIIKNHKYIETKIISEIELYFSQKSYIHGTPVKDIVNTSASGHSYNATCDDNNILNAIDQNNGDIPTGMSSYLSEPISSIDNNHIQPGEYTLESESFKNMDNSSDKNLVTNSSPSKYAFLNKKSRISNDVSELHSSQNINGSENQTFEDHFDVNFSPAYACMREETLEHPNVIIDKEDFLNMNIIGQFNRGFILCSLEKNNENFLITVDQHAADEIYNFELLKEAFYLKKQRLVAPIDLDITAIQELIIEDNRMTFERNGFTVDNKKILTIPVYKGHFFTIEDFNSLLENISCGIFESNKFRDIMASKACRSSIMIGTSLNIKEMRKVVNNLATLRQPWNCPHGRPTFKIITKLP